MAGIDFVAVDYMQDLSGIGTIITATGGNALYIKSDDEDEWSELTAPDGAQIYDVGYLAGNILSVGSNSMIYFSSDMGENWENTELNEETDLIAVDYETNLGLAGGTNGKLYYRIGSNDWMLADINAAEDINIYDVHVATSKFIAVGDSGNVYVSTDEGSSWKTYVVNGKTTLLKICSTPSGRIFIGGAGSIYELNDNSIELINSDIDGVITAIYADESSEMLYCATSEGTTYSYNLANEELIQSEVLTGEILDFAWAGNTWILAGQNASLYKVEVEGGNSVALDLHIDEVKIIPNPTSGEFNLVINSEQTYPIDIEIFDVSGKSVYLKSGAYISQGENQFEISLDDAVGSGNYYVSVKSGNTIISEQLVIIK